MEKNLIFKKNKDTEELEFVCECEGYGDNNQYIDEDMYIAKAVVEKNSMWMRVGLNIYFTDAEIEEIFNAEPSERKIVIEKCFDKAFIRRDFELAGETYSNDQHEYYNYLVNKDNKTLFVGQIDILN